MTSHPERPATLFDYPAQPGWRKNAPETSRIAAVQVAGEAEILRGQCLDVLVRTQDGLTADEVAVALNRSVLSIRPRISELRAAGLVSDTGIRRRNVSGHSAAVWAAVGGRVTPNGLAGGAEIPPPSSPASAGEFETVNPSENAALRALRGR